MSELREMAIVQCLHHVQQALLDFRRSKDSYQLWAGWSDCRMVISVRSRLEERNDSIYNVRTDGRWPWYILNYYCVACGWYLKSSTWLCGNGMGWCIPFSFDWYQAHQLVIVHSCSTWIWVLDNYSVHRANFRVVDDCSRQNTASTMLRFEWIQLIYSN